MRVTQVLRYDASLYRGGGEIKAERTREALAKRGVEVEVYGPLTTEFGDLVHFFGTFGYFWGIARYCLERGVPYVCSPIFVTPRSVRRLKWRAFRQQYLEMKGSGDHRHLYRNAKELYFQTSMEQKNALAFFGTDIAPQTIVPNGVEERFAHGDARLFREKYGIDGPYVLQTGVIAPNKGQLALIQALRENDIAVVILGRVSDKAYADACKKAAGPNVYFLDAVPHDAPDLASAYAGAFAFCLASTDDIFANSAMEAAVAGCRLILGDSWGGQEIYGDWAKWVKPRDPTAVRKAVEEWRESTHHPAGQSTHFLKDYSWDRVAGLLESRYAAILNRQDSKMRDSSAS